MYRAKLSESEKEKLREIRFLNPNLDIQRRSDIVLLCASDIHHAKTAEIMGCHRNTITNVLRNYRKSGLLGLQSLPRPGRKSELNQHMLSIKESFDNKPVRSVNEACNRIKELTEIARKPTQVRKILHHLGFKRLVSGAMPCPKNKSPAEHAMDQKTFLENTLKPLLNECAGKVRDVFFIDASHFVYASFVCALWCRVRQWVRAASGRQRHNVLGALHATTHDLTTVINDTYVTATTVCELFRKLRAQASPHRLITVVLDNAKYQRCDLVEKCAVECKIELCFLPSYSPNLNLIERYWKHVKKTCLYGCYYATYKEFNSAIDACIMNPTVKDKEKLKSLLSLNFQTFEDAQLYTN